jgi:putative membrane-bound dehydrogenase-like protein
MKHILFLLTFLLAAQARAAEGPIRVLFLGHENQRFHASARWCALLMQNLGREGIYFDYEVSPECLTPERLRHYDAVMHYGNHGGITAAQFEALQGFVESGHGFLPIHSASACFKGEPRFARLVGGRFLSHKAEVFKPVFLEKSHPVLEGVNEYQTWDETYVHDEHNPLGRRLLAERVDPQHREPWTWVREQGKGRVFYTASGHDERTWGDADFQKMLRNAILWCVGDRRKAEWRRFLDSREPERRDASVKVPVYEKAKPPVTYQRPFSVKGAMERIQVPADCRLEIFAAEPDIAKPIAFAWDERGRLWVAETRDYPHGLAPSGEGRDSIKICEDTDGDGKADKFTVFADKLNIPTGLVLVNGGVVVAQAPRFLFLKDTDGDDRADVRQTIMEGWGIKDTHAQASNLHYGYDNWLHGCVGYSGFDGAVGGKKMQFIGGIYRFRADGSALEFRHQFGLNSWAWGANEAGDLFGGLANGAPILFGGIPKTIVPEGMSAMTAKKISVTREAHAITPNLLQVDGFGGYTSAANSHFIYSKNLPARFQGKAMICEPTVKVVALMDVRPEGAGYVAHDAMNLFASSDEWTSPVFAEVGPDGAVWIADWQNFILQHNPANDVLTGMPNGEKGEGNAHITALRDHGRGRIYRVIAKEANLAKKSLAESDASRLVAALDDDVQYWRLLAQKNLVEGKFTQAAEALRLRVTSRIAGPGAIHALWSLKGLGLLDEATHRHALTSKDAALRRNAIRALDGDAKAQTLFFSSPAVTDPDPLTRLEALVKLGEFATSPELRTLVAKLTLDDVIRRDEWLKTAAEVLARKHQAAAYADGPNLLANAGFEELGANKLPSVWTSTFMSLRRAPQPAAGEPAAIYAERGQNAKDGNFALKIIPHSETSPMNSMMQEVAVKPNTSYRLSGWIRDRVVGDVVLMEQHSGASTARLSPRDDGWIQVETIFNSKNQATARVVLVAHGRGGAFFDDIRLCEQVPGAAVAVAKPEPGDARRGAEIFWHHPVASCKNCHMLQGQGTVVGPALDGIAARRDAAYLNESLINPNAKLAEGFEKLGISPMPPMNLLLKPQELEDLKAFLQTLK